MALPALRDFSLVGGTALSLLYGHRKSIDIDLFCDQPFETESVANTLTHEFSSSFSIRTSTNFGLFGFIEDVKVDFVRHYQPLLNPSRTLEGIKMFSLEDIVAMKVQAILGRGRKKDFWDIAELLDHYSVGDFVDFHKSKYSGQNLMITVPQAMTFFNDADTDEDPIGLKGQTWSSVKTRIAKSVRGYLT